MTKRPNPKNQDMSLLKTLLLVGSVAGTLVGTRLLAVQDTEAVTAVSEPEQVIIIQTAPTTNTALPMPPTSAGDQAIVLDLAPVPQAITPQINPVQVQQMQPVARTKSS